MFSNYKFKIYYNVGDSGFVADGSNMHFELKSTFDGTHLKINIQPKSEIELVHAELLVDYNYPQNVRVMPNGYQSWTETREYIRGEKQRGIPDFYKIIPTGYKMVSIFGDYTFKRYPKTPNVFHGYTFGYIADGDKTTLIGSLSERVGYTIINFDLNNNNILMEKELEGKIISDECDLYDIIVFSGSYDGVFDSYFKAMNLSAPIGGRTCGYTSWYNYYTNINEKIAIRDLNNISVLGDKVGIFQIDDGYQSYVGDWETPNEKFPNGMKYIADSIHQKGYKAGLWLAPFYIQKISKVAKEHPEWILKDNKGKPLFGFLGTRPCYTLDFYIPECANYIKHFFNTILNDWGFDMVKLDFLYTACILPRNGKSRGEIMCEAMDFLRECVGDKLILGCGVPLGPSFGKVDFCRIGSDVDLVFKPRWFAKCTNREVISTQTAIKNTLFRRGLNGRAFGNDPDVFYLRNNVKADENSKKSKKALGFSWKQRELWAGICKNLGNIIFTSDNVGDYDNKQLDTINYVYDAPDKKVEEVAYLGKDTVSVIFTADGKRYNSIINWNTGVNDTAEIK